MAPGKTSRVPSRETARSLINRVSIRGKLLIVIMTVSLCAMLLASVVVLFFQRSAFREWLADDLSATAGLIADNTKAALSFDDPSDAETVLQSLQVIDSITAATLYTREGVEFASWYREGSDPLTPLAPESEGYRLYNGDMFISRHVLVNDQIIGTVVLRSNQRELTSFVRRSVIAIGQMILLGSILALVLSTRLQRIISSPITYLAGIMESITREQDYSLRAVKLSDDELGQLTGHFNDMLAQIATRDEQIGERQQLLRSIIDNTSSVIYLKDLEGRYLMVNKRWEQVFLTSNQDIVGKTDLELFSEHVGERFRANDLVAFETDSVVEFEEEVPQEDSIHHYISAKFPVHDQRGQTYAIGGISTDVTGLKRAEEELTRHRDHLEELVNERTRDLKAAQEQLVRRERLAALGQLTATMGHEIRNPLGTVRTSIFSIRGDLERNKPEHINRALTLAERNIVRCDLIIDELLDYTSQKVLKTELVDIDTWLGELLDEQGIPQGIECKRDFHSDIALPVDREYLRRAAVNVFSNAIEAMGNEESRGKELNVETGVSGERLAISFSDDGPGMADHIQEKIFEPLFSTKVFGVGLGLAIAKDIMEAHGGGIEIQSDVAKGTTVTLWLPLPRAGGDME